MIYSNRFLLSFVFLGMTFLSCCSPTPYRPNNSNGGYSEFRIAQDTFAVTFEGNTYTTNEAAYKYALMRASELTLQNGFTHFSVLESRDNSKRRLFATSGYITEEIAPCIQLTIKCYLESPQGVETVDASGYINFNWVNRDQE